MSALELPRPLVDHTWLATHLHHPQLCILDASWHLPTAERDGPEEWRASRIPGAQHFDYHSVVRDSANELPRMMPSAAVFTACARELGINADSRIVVYDRNGLFSSPRAWWMFRAMGHEQIAVLDGGFDAWEQAGHPIDTAPATTVEQPGNFQADEQVEAFVDADTVLQALHSDKQVLDARSAARFDAAHMPGASNLPYSDLLQNGHLRPPEDLQKYFQRLTAAEQPIICSCGSGVTACVIALAAARSNYGGQISVYDGSWSEWGNRDDLPKQGTDCD